MYCLYVQPIRLQLRRYRCGYLWNRNLWRMSTDSIQAPASTQIESSKTTVSVSCVIRCLIYSLYFLLCFWEQRVGGKVFYWAALRMQKTAADKVNIMECDPLLHDQLIQTGSQEIWLVQSRSVNPHTAREIPYSPGCPAPMFSESVHRVNTTDKLKQCGSRKALLS